MSLYTDGTYLQNNPTWHAEDAPWKLSHVLRALKKAGISKIHTVCDVGCGSGVLIKTWSNMQPEIAFTGYDISPQALALCQQQAPKNATFLGGEKIPSGPFDISLGMDVMEHVPDDEAWLDQLTQIASFTVLHIPLELSFYTRLRSSWLEEQRRLVGHIHFYTPGAVERLFKRHHLKILSWHYTNKYVETSPQIDNLLGKVGMCIRQVLHVFLPRRIAALTVGGYSVMCVVSHDKENEAV